MVYLHHSQEAIVLGILCVSTCQQTIIFVAGEMYHSSKLHLRHIRCTDERDLSHSAGDLIKLNIHCSLKSQNDYN